MSRLALRELAGRTVARFLCASYLAAFAGLRDSHYDVDKVLHPFVEKHELLTENEWARLVNRGGFARTGDRYRELIAWAIGVVQRERNDGRSDVGDAKLIIKAILRLRANLAVGYHMLGQPMPFFVYVHLVRVLTTCYCVWKSNCRRPTPSMRCCLRNCICSMAWRFHAIDATLSRSPRLLDGVEVHKGPHNSSQDNLTHWLISTQVLPAGLRIRAGEARLARSRGPRPCQRRYLHHLLLFPGN